MQLQARGYWLRKAAPRKYIPDRSAAEYHVIYGVYQVIRIPEKTHKEKTCYKWNQIR